MRRSLPGERASKARALDAGRAANVVVAIVMTACTPFIDEGSLDAAPPALSEAGPSPLEAGPPCDPSAAFPTPMPVAGLTNIGATSVGGLRLSPDYRTGYFYATGRADSLGGADLYSATRTSPTSPFGNVLSLGSGVNTPNDEYDPTVRADGNLIVFSETKAQAGNLSGLEQATRVGGAPFSGAGPLPGAFTAAYDETPFLTPDGSTLYFASVRGSINLAIYTAAATASAFDAPQLLPGTLNSFGNDLAPVVTPDELTIYYASDRSDGNALGSFDVWAATRATTADFFAAPFDVQQVNSSEPDFPTFVTADGCTLYLSSMRGGTLSMYVATKTPP